MWKEAKITYTSSDALRLSGTLLADSAKKSETPIAILVHGGGGVDRDEDGFYTKLAQFFADYKIATLRFDHRAFLAAKDKSIIVTINGMVDDIKSTITYVNNLKKFSSVHLVGASFGGGASLIASNDSPSVMSNILINPLIDYKDRLLKEKDFWKENDLTTKGKNDLLKKGFLKHGSTLKMKAPLIVELARMEFSNFWSELLIPPTLIIHGTKDSRISYLKSLEAEKSIKNINVQLIEGADHGLAVPDDDEFEMPQTLEWQKQAYDMAKDWIIKNTSK